jgi:glycogen synthase
MQARAMARDFDWSVAARQYVELYEAIASGSRGL